MNPATTSWRLWAATSKQLARRIILIGVNRLELLLLEVQEGGNSLLRAIGLMIGICVCSCMSLLTLTALVIVSLWHLSPVGALLGVTGLYLGAALLLGRQLKVRVSQSQVLPESRDQLRKDREQLKELLK